MSSKFNLAIVVFICIVLRAQAIDLVIAKDGSSFWAQNVSTNGTTLSCVLNDSGAGTNAALRDIDVVIHGVDRGKKYTDDEMDAALRMISDARARHNNLMKQLKILQNEWDAIRTTSGSEIDQAIEETTASFETNKHSASAYSVAILSLGMSRCKDVSGVHSAKLDKAVCGIQEAYLGVSIAHIEALSNTAKITTEEFLKIKKPVIAAIKKEMPPEEKGRLLAALDKARATALRCGLADAAGAVAAAKTIDSYLVSRTILVPLKKEVAETKDEKIAVEKALSGVIMGVKSAQPDYELDSNGYPLSRKDRDMLAVTQAYSSTQLIFGMPVEEQCLIIVKEIPKPVPVGKQTAIPMTLIFNCLQQNSEEYCMVISGAGGKDSAKLREKLPSVSSRNGHLDWLFPLDLSRQVLEMKPLHDNDGAYVLAYLACRPLSDDKKDANVEWKAISMACRLPVAD